MSIEIWSDIVCPWCAIGKAHLEAALAEFEHADKVDVTWRSFELDPGAPAVRDGDYTAMLAGKYGTSLADGQAMVRRMTEAAANAGLEFRLDRARPGNSFDAHRLVHLAVGHGRQGGVMQRFMHGYLSEGEAIGDRGTLIRLATEAGLDPGEVRAVLDSGGYADAVRADEEDAFRLGVHAVPLFLLDRKLAIPGAQPAEMMLRALHRMVGASRDRHDAAETDHGPVCGPGGCTT